MKSNNQFFLKTFSLFLLFVFFGCISNTQKKPKEISAQIPLLSSFDSPIIRGNQILHPETGEEIQLRGVNLGQWFLWESYLWGLYPKEGYQEYFNIPQNELLKKLDTILPKSLTTQEFWNRYQKNFITEWDFEFLKNHNINLVRVPIHHYMFENEWGLGAIRRVIDLCEEFEIYCLLDIHAVRGAQSSYSPSDPVNGKVEFWDNKVLQNEYFSDLAILSNMSSGRPYVLGYDLLNEPEVEDVQVLKDFYLRAISFLRKRGDNKILVVETNKVSLRVPEVYLGDELQNILYSAHYYGKGSAGRENFESVWKFVTEKNIPFFVGEYGNWANDLFAQYSDKFLIYDFEIFGFHHAYWPYKDLIPEVTTRDNNFGLFSGPDSPLWQEFFLALNSEVPLTDDFPFDEFFQMIRSENLTEKNFVVDLFDIPKKGIIEIDTNINWPKRWSGDWWKKRMERWQSCDGKTFLECRGMLF